jgi:hypothetical protein
MRRIICSPLMKGIALFCFFICTSAPAQSVMKEVVSIAASVGYAIDPMEREKYALFPQYRNFIIAEFLQREDQYFLRIAYREDGRRFVEHITLSYNEFKAYQQQITTTDERIRSGGLKQPSTAAQRQGRLHMVTDAFFYGSMLYGPGTIALLDINGTQATGVELVAAGGAFAVGLNATKEHRLGYGRSKLIRWGNYAGTAYGLALPVFFSSENEKAYLSSAMLCTPVGGFLAYKLSSHRWFRKGETDLIATGGLIGGLYGLAIPYLYNIDALENRTQAKIYAASAMAGIPFGVLATTRLIRRKPINQGRAHLITLGGLVGGLYGAGMVNLAGMDPDDDPRAYILSTAVGIPLGTYVGYRLTSQEENSLGQAWLISVGTYAGALFSSGVVLAAGIEQDKPYILAAMLGSAAGMWYTHKATKGLGEEVTLRPGRRGATPNSITVSLPSFPALFSFGALALHNSPSENVPLVELFRVSF